MSIGPSSLETIARPQEGRKYFTLSEANRALIYIRPVVGDITGVYGRIIDLRRELDHPPAGEAAGGLEREYQQAMDRLSDLVDELHVVGVELKDFEIGLVDFPSLHEDREIYLSWQTGEQAVEHWHEADAGIAGRQAIERLTA